MEGVKWSVQFYSEIYKRTARWPFGENLNWNTKVSFLRFILSNCFFFYWSVPYLPPQLCPTFIILLVASLCLTPPGHRPTLIAQHESQHFYEKNENKLSQGKFTIYEPVRLTVMTSTKQTKPPFLCFCPNPKFCND